MPRSANTPTHAWLRGPAFDLGLIGGVLLLALVLGGIAMLGEDLFYTVLVLDIWLLAYPHVASTFTRIAFDHAGVRRHWFLLFVLPPIVLLGTAAVAGYGGLLAIGSLYYYWQSWHYTRQSHGIARAYHRIHGAPGPDRLSDALILAFPLWGVLHRIHQQPGEFYDIALWTPTLPPASEWLAAGVALALLLVWAVRHLRAASTGTPRSRGHALFILSHILITVVSYLLISDITQGWLFINLWHNAQYLLFVWAMNMRRFHGGPDPARRFLSQLCQPGQVKRYALTCIALSWTLYLALGLTPDTLACLAWPALPLLLVVHMAVNFHHYVIDAVIWRSPRANRDTPVRTTPAHARG